MLLFYAPRAGGGLATFRRKKESLSRSVRSGGRSGCCHNGLFKVERTFGDLFFEGLAVEVGHCHERAAVGLVDLVESTDVGMVESRRRFGFTNETFLGFLIGQKVRREELESDCLLR